MTLQEIYNIKWKEVCEEDFWKLRKKHKPILLYMDIHGNVFHYFDEENLSTSHNTDYDSESNDSTPQGDIEQSSTSHNQNNYANKR